MTQEEKLEEAKRLYETANADQKYVLERLFPSLKESEDERIRKHLIGVVELYYGNTDEQEKKDCLNWLEKQNLVIEMKTPEESLGVDSDTYSKIVDECVYGEQKPADKKGMNLVEEEMTPFQKKVFCIIDTTIEEEQGLKQVCDELLRLAHDKIIQNTAWSEEDRRMLIGLIDELDAIMNKSTPNEISVYSKYINWLKSLRLQSHWKPSEEQMGALRVLSLKCQSQKQFDIIGELIEQLKVLQDDTKSS